MVKQSIGGLGRLAALAAHKQCTAAAFGGMCVGSRPRRAAASQTNSTSFNCSASSQSEAIPHTKLRRRASVKCRVDVAGFLIASEQGIVAAVRYEACAPDISLVAHLARLHSLVRLELCH